MLECAKSPAAYILDRGDDFFEYLETAEYFGHCGCALPDLQWARYAGASGAADGNSRRNWRGEFCTFGDDSRCAFRQKQTEASGNGIIVLKQKDAGNTAFEPHSLRLYFDRSEVILLFDPMIQKAGTKCQKDAEQQKTQKQRRAGVVQLGAQNGGCNDIRQAAQKPA